MNVHVYTTGEKLPQLLTGNFFHSSELMAIVGRTTGQKPFMAVATDAGGRVVGQMLAIVRGRLTWVPPFYYAQGRIYGEGTYCEELCRQEASPGDGAKTESGSPDAEGYSREDVFGLLVDALTQRLRRRLCFLTEVGNLSRKMMGYKSLRRNHYFPVGWQEIRHSLHSRTPMERIDPQLKAHIDHAIARGAVTTLARDDHEVRLVYRLIHRRYRWRPYRFPPTESVMVEAFHRPETRTFVTRYNDRIIGGCALVCIGSTAYLWHIATRRKRYRLLHPEEVTVWGAMTWAWHEGYDHFVFLDAGLPLPHNPYRESLLRFGGKPVSSYRWFRISIGWMNKVAEWLTMK